MSVTAYQPAYVRSLAKWWVGAALNAALNEADLTQQFPDEELRTEVAAEIAKIAARNTKLGVPPPRQAGVDIPEDAPDQLTEERTA